jgi:hypothetical protein
MDGIYNAKLYEVVRGLYEEIVAEFAAELGAEKLHSEEFLSSFPYSFMHDAKPAGQIADAALQYVAVFGLSGAR